ncbi:MAG: PDZ domain-containing protein [Akkermansia sp.]|nr:PDZ domain-containing protein [Akkermansia sp.]
MYRQLIVIALSGLVLTCCEPTERTAITKKEDKKQPTEQSVQETSAATTPVEQPADTESSAPEVTEPAVTAPTEQEPTVTPADTPQPTPADASDAEQPADKTADAASSQLSVALTVQDYNRVMPWEKQSASSTRLNGVYLGDGKVLTLGSSLASANYVEISLPDASRTVPARVLRYDSDLNLGLLVVDNEEDATIFETRSALAVGAAMDKDAKAELWCTLNGTQPAAIALQGEIGTTDRGLPRLQMRTDQAVPGNYSHGAPVVADGKLVGISAGYNSAARQLKVINAELISRFLNADAAAPKGVPVMGVSMAELTDPVFRRYLKLSDDRTGIYVSNVQPTGAAAAAGLKKGDVLTSIEGLKIDNRGRCNLPRYGMVDVATVARYLKPLGETLKITYCRDGQEFEAEMQLNRDAEEKALIRTEANGAAPRYLVWGGLVFQPLTTNYLEALKTEAKALPIEFMKLEDREEELQQRGFRELTALTIVVPTKATMGYDSCNFAMVEKVNGAEPHSFEEFVSLLKAPTESGMVEIDINKPPYRIYMESAAAEAANDELRRAGIIKLQRLTEQD